MSLSLNDYLVKAKKNPDNTFTDLSPVQPFQVTSLNPLVLTPWVAPPPPPPPPPPTTATQLPIHVFAADGKCTPLKTLAALTRWNKPPVVTGDQWKLVYYAYSPSDGALLTLDFVTNNGQPHTTTQAIFQGGALVQQQTIILPNNLTRDIGGNEWVDFYSDGDSGQMFWYGPGAASINFTYNFEAFKTSSFFSEVSLTVEPLTPFANLTFTQLDTSLVELGQISNNTANGTPILVQFNQEPAPSSCSLGQRAPSNTNACWMNPKLNPSNQFGFSISAGASLLL